MNRLFNKYNASNELGNKIIDDTDELISNLFEKYKNNDVDLNDFETIVVRTIQVFMAEQRLYYGHKLHKQEQRSKVMNQKELLNFLEKA